jgi:hypothetical protein
MTAEDFIIHLLYLVDDRMGNLPKHSRAHLYPSELVTIGLLFALKGGYFRAFYRWLKRDYAPQFAGIPERTRLQRLLETHQDWCRLFLAAPTFFTVIDSYGIELIHPIRENRSPQQIGKKGKSNWRWIIGMKLCWLINDVGAVVDWAWDTANVHDQVFQPLVATLSGISIVLADVGFQDADGVPDNLKLCPRGTWNERMLVETVLSLVTLVAHLKRCFIVPVIIFKPVWLIWRRCLTACCGSIVAYNPMRTLRIGSCIWLNLLYELAPTVSSKNLLSEHKHGSG